MNSIIIFYKLFMSLNLQDRQFYHYYLCIPLRILFLFLLYFYYTHFPNYIQYSILIILLTISFTFMYLYLFHLRLQSYESGGNTWWKEYRIYHSIFYFLSFLLLFYKQPIYWPIIVLFANVVFSLITTFFQYS